MGCCVLLDDARCIGTDDAKVGNMLGQGALTGAELYVKYHDGYALFHVWQGKCQCLLYNVLSN